MSNANESTGMHALGLLTGIVFGGLLQRGRFGRQNTITKQICFKDWRVVKTMASATLVGGLGIHYLVKKGLIKKEVKPLKVGGVVGGAVLFGTGMAVCGYCPGTSLAAVGEGRRDALSGVLGMAAGAGLFVSLYPKILPLIEAGGDFGKVTLPSLLKVSACEPTPRQTIANHESFA